MMSNRAVGCLLAAVAAAVAAVAEAGEGAPPRRFQSTPEYAIVLPDVEPDAAGVDLQIYDARGRVWRTWGKFELQREGAVTKGGTTVFRAPREGEFALRAAARDEVGNARAGGGPETADLVAVFDRTPPAVEITAPPPGARFDPGSEVRLAWRAREATPLARGGAAVEVSTDGGRTWRAVVRRTDDTGGFVLAAPETEGAFALRVTIVDACGNRGSALSRDLAVRTPRVERPPQSPAEPLAVKRPAVAPPVVKPPVVAPPPMQPNGMSDTGARPAPDPDTLSGEALPSGGSTAAVRVLAPVEIESAAPDARPSPVAIERPAAPDRAVAVPALPRVRSSTAGETAAARSNARELHATGARALAAGRLAEAGEALRAAVGSDPSLEAAWLDLSVALARAGKLDETLATLARAEERFPKSAAFPLNRGLVLVRLGRTTDARTALERAVRLQPSSAEAHWTLGLVAVGEEDLGRARAHWREVVKWSTKGSPLRVRAELYLRESD